MRFERPLLNPRHLPGERHLPLLALTFSLLAAACGKQGEGERCDINNTGVDCEPGLTCRSADQLNIEGGRGVALCCPIDPTRPTVTACQAGAELPPEDETPPMPVDAGDSGS